MEGESGTGFMTNPRPTSTPTSALTMSEQSIFFTSAGGGWQQRTSRRKSSTYHLTEGDLSRPIPF